MSSQASAFYFMPSISCFSLMSQGISQSLKYKIAQNHNLNNLNRQAHDELFLSCEF